MGDSIFDKPSDVVNEERTKGGEQPVNQTTARTEDTSIQQNIAPTGDDFTDQLRQLESLAKIDPSVREMDEYKDLMSKVNSDKGGKPESKAVDKKPAPIVDEEEEEDEEEDDDDLLTDDDDPFGIFKEEKKSKPIKLDFEAPKEMKELLKSKYGIEDESTFFSSVDTWRNQAQQGTEFKNQYEALQSDLQSMPPDLIQAVTSWANGEDYTKVFEANERLDFKKDFQSQDIENLVQHYLPKQYNGLLEMLDSEKITEEEFEDKVKLLSATTERFFTEDKRALETKRAEYIERQKNESKMMRNSAISSVENLSKAYPNFSKSELAKIRSILVEGKVDDLFYKPDGSYTDNAAELVANAFYASKVRGMIEKVAKRKGESEANQRIVDSSPTTVRKQRSNSEQKTSGIDKIQHLMPVFTKDPYE